jgi:transposase InsO family protein
MSRNVLEDIRRTTESDNDLRQVKHCIQNEWPSYKEFTANRTLQTFWKIKDFLTVVGGLILKGEKILIPRELQPEILRKLHTGHMGREKTKRRARNLVYWPNINRGIDEMISQCNTCMDFRNQNSKEPLVVTTIHDGPWQTEGTDLFSLHNCHYLVVTDYYSRYFEVTKLPNTKSNTVIDRLKSIFARHSIPYEVKSDNGQQYTSQEFRQFTKDWNFKHTTSSPYHQQANGLAEKTVQTVKRLLEKARIDGSDPYLGILEYRNTPTDTESPAQLLMSRELRSILPITKNRAPPNGT